MGNRPFLSSYTFKMGLECPTRLYYESQSQYPAARQDQALIDHIRYNKQQLAQLARILFPEGDAINEASIEKEAELSKRQLTESEQVVLYDARFLYENYYHRFPIVVKNKEQLNLYELKTKAINPRKHHFASREGKIYSKWRSAFLDLAFGRFIAENLFNTLDIHAHLILPDKTASSPVNYQSFFSFEDGKVRIDSEYGDALRDKINILTYHKVDPWIQKYFDNDVQEKDLHPVWNGVDFADRIREMAKMLNEQDKYPPLLDMHCRTCPFRVSKDNLKSEEKSGFDECWTDKVDRNSLEAGHHIFNLIGHGTETYLRKGYITLDQVPLRQRDKSALDILQEGRKISYDQRQSLQIMRAKGKEVPTEFVKEQLFSELDRVEYPLFFMDFEAANFAVPFKKGSRPYESLAFQWSCHVLYEDHTLKHYDWIHEKVDEYPNYEFLRALLAIPDLMKGTIVQYSPFEKQMIKDIRRSLMRDIKEGDGPGDADELMDGLDRLLDGDKESLPVSFLDMNQLVRDYYFHRDMNGSLGLKDVIAAAIGTSETLEDKYSNVYESSNFDAVYWWQEDPVDESGRDPYEIVEEKGEGISKGSEALIAFIELQRKDLSRQERRSIIDALLKYCELDTLSMVMMYQHWQEMKK